MGGMSKGLRKDDAGQMYTIEAVLAVSMMIAALYIVMVFTPMDITPGQDFAEVQLYHYGRDVLMLLSYRDAEIAVGLLEYVLYREHNPDKWEHDVNVTSITEVCGRNWTRDYLHINHDGAGEPLNVDFLIFDVADGTWEGLPGYIECTTTIVSDTTAEWLDEATWRPAAACWVHPNWPSISGATWIWTRYLVDPYEEYHTLPPEGYRTFRKTFTIPDGAFDISGSINIGADNAYRLYINGAFLGADGALSRDGPDFQEWQTIEAFNFIPQLGTNEILIKAVNYLDTGTATSNPSGLIFKATVSYRLPTEPAVGGSLYVVEYYGVDGGAVREIPGNDITFRHYDVGMPHLRNYPKHNYTINMVWFKDVHEEVSTPVLVWVDKKPEGRDDSFNITDPELTAEQERLQYVVIGSGGTIETMLKGGVEGYGGIWDSLSVRGWPYVWETGEIPGNIGGTTPMETFTMELIDEHSLELRFHPWVRGGYAIWAIDSDPIIGWECVHSHPIFVIVGRPGLAPGEVISPFEAALEGIISLTELNHLLRSYIPENVEYNLAVSNSTGEIAHMNIINGIPAPGAITVTISMFATVDGVSEVYMVRLILWYR